MKSAHKLKVNIAGEEYMPSSLRTEPQTLQAYRLGVEEAGEALSNITSEDGLNPDGLVVVMRAGLGLLAPFMRRYPDADVGFIDIDSPNEEELPATMQSIKIPESLNDGEVILLESVIAYGKAACMAVEALKERRITAHIASIVVSDCVESRLNEAGCATLNTLAVDEMDDNGWLQPGIGDAGDRQWGQL